MKKMVIRLANHVKKPMQGVVNIRYTLHHNWAAEILSLVLTRFKVIIRILYRPAPLPPVLYSINLSSWGLPEGKTLTEVNE